MSAIPRLIPTIDRIDGCAFGAAGDKLALRLKKVRRADAAWNRRGWHPY